MTLKEKTRMVFGSGRFGSVITNNLNYIEVGGYDVPTKLVDKFKDVSLCLPTDLARWGMYPTHQDSWLCLSFVVACHATHEDEAGLEIRRQAWQAIPEIQWPALAAKAAEFAVEFRERLVSEELGDRKVYKSLTRVLQDCVLYLAERKFPEDQDGFLAGSPIASLIEMANRGRAGQLTPDEGLELADRVDALVSELLAEFGSLAVCQEALKRLEAGPWPAGRVILLPAEITLEQGAELAAYDLMIGTPDEHDMDCVSAVGFVNQPTLVQLADVLSGQRLDVIAVPEFLGPDDELTGGHPSFQTVAEMLLANGTSVSAVGRALVSRLASRVSPVELAQKYLVVACEFLFDATLAKSWAARRNNPAVPQIKKAIPLYRVACDLLPRAAAMLRGEGHTGGRDIAKLAADCGLSSEYQTIRAMLDSQQADQAELEAVAAVLAARCLVVV